MFYAQNNIILFAIYWATLLGLQIKSIALIMLLVIVNPGLARIGDKHLIQISYWADGNDF